MAYQIYAGSTSQTVRFFIQDSSSTTGSGLTGLAYNTSGLTAYYVKAATGTATAITLATQTATGAYSSGGFCAVDGTNMPGVYRLDLPNAAVDTEAEVIVMLKGAANMAPVAIRITCAKLQVNTVTNADKTGYSLTATTGLGNQTANITGNLSGSVGSVTGAVGSVTSRVTANTDQWGGVAVTGMPMPTYTQPTGFLAATFPGTVSSFAGGAVASVTGNVGGNVSGSVGSISGVTFPSNFASLGINSSGHVLRVVLVDTTTTNTDMRGTDNALLAASYTAPLNTAGTAAAVWDALLATYTTAGSFGARVVRSVNSNNQLQITGSNHAAADVHEFQDDVLTDAAIDGTAVTLLQAGLATSANQTTIIDRVTYGLTALVGACSDAQTAAETYTLTIGGSTYTVDYSGLDSSGNRSTTTLSKV